MGAWPSSMMSELCWESLSRHDAEFTDPPHRPLASCDSVTPLHNLFHTSPSCSDVTGSPSATWHKQPPRLANTRMYPTTHAVRAYIQSTVQRAHDGAVLHTHGHTLFGHVHGYMHVDQQRPPDTREQTSELLSNLHSKLQSNLQQRAPEQSPEKSPAASSRAISRASS